MRVVTYAIDQESGLVYSRFCVHGSTKGFAVPVLDFKGMMPENNFRTSYDLQRFDHLDIGTWSRLTWTKKISKAIKNLHRSFWGMDPLRD